MNKVNLYAVYCGDHNYCYFVFAATANKARALCVNYNYDEAYIDLRAYILNKDVGGTADVVVDDKDCKGYERVLALGFGYSKDDNPEYN